MGLLDWPCVVRATRGTLVAHDVELDFASRPAIVAQDPDLEGKCVPTPGFRTLFVIVIVVHQLK